MNHNPQLRILYRIMSIVMVSLSGVFVAIDKASPPAAIIGGNAFCALAIIAAIWEIADLLWGLLATVRAAAAADQEAAKAGRTAQGTVGPMIVHRADQ